MAMHCAGAIPLDLLPGLATWSAGSWRIDCIDLAEFGYLVEGVRDPVMHTTMDGIEDGRKRNALPSSMADDRPASS